MYGRRPVMLWVSLASPWYYCFNFDSSSSTNRWFKAFYMSLQLCQHICQCLWIKCVVLLCLGNAAVPIWSAEDSGNTPLPPCLSERSSWAEAVCGGGAFLWVNRRPSESQAKNLKAERFWFVRKGFDPRKLRPKCFLCLCSVLSLSHGCHWDPVQQDPNLLLWSLRARPFHWLEVRLTAHTFLIKHHASLILYMKAPKPLYLTKGL